MCAGFELLDSSPSKSDDCSSSLSRENAGTVRKANWDSRSKGCRCKSTGPENENHENVERKYKSALNLVNGSD